MRSENMFSKHFLSLTIASLLVLGAIPARADTAVLGNDFRLPVERQEADGSRVRLFIAGGGYVELEASQLESYEKDAVPEAPPATQSVDAVSAAGYLHGLDPLLLKSVIAEESNFNPRAVSPKGAMGLMQLMPGTAVWLGVKDFFSAAENVQGGALYLRPLLERYRGDLVKALAAYNAGPARVDRYGGIPPYAETQSYVRRVIERFNRLKTVTSGQ